MTAILFDLDGTLVDSRRDIACAANHALAHFGLALLDEAVLGTMVGDGARVLIERAVKEAGADPEPDRVRAMLAVFDAFYLEHPAVHSRVLPGALEALKALRAEPLAVVTNKKRATTMAVLDALDLGWRFRVIVAGGDAAHLKPHAAPVMMALERLRAKTGVMVGDGTQDIGAGKAAGCITVAVLGGFHERALLEAEKPDHVIRTLHELAPLLHGSPAGT